MGRLKTGQEKLAKRLDKKTAAVDKSERKLNGFRSKWIEKKEKQLENANKFKNQAIHNAFNQLNVPQKKG